MKTYIILGSNNFWYSKLEGTIKDAKNEVKALKQPNRALLEDEPCTPDIYYIFEVTGDSITIK